MRRIFVGLAAIALSFTIVGPVLGSAEVTNFQYRTYGAEAWFTNVSADSPKGLYYDAYVQAFVGQDSRPGRSLEWVYVGYQVWEKRPNGDLVLRSDQSGYAPDGAAGLSMGVADLTWATVRTSVPVGWCREYQPEDAGGDCIDYVTVGTVDLDLAWTPTTKLLSWNSTDQEVVPAQWLWTSRRTSHYREAALTGQVTFPDWGSWLLRARTATSRDGGSGSISCLDPTPDSDPI